MNFETPENKLEGIRAEPGDSTAAGLKPGMAADAALQAFIGACNKIDTLFITEGWIGPRLQSLQRLLSDPITSDQADALTDALLKRIDLDGVIEWLADGKVCWKDFFSYDRLQEREIRFEGAEAIYREEWVIARVRLFDVRFQNKRDRGKVSRVAEATAEIIPTEGLTQPPRSRWRIRADDPPHDWIWFGGQYSGWIVYFDKEVVETVLAMAADCFSSQAAPSPVPKIHDYLNGYLRAKLSRLAAQTTRAERT